MIDEIDAGLTPEMGGPILALSDTTNGRLTVHKTGELAGLVVSNSAPDGAITAAAIHLSRADRAALIRTLIELQEDEELL